MTRDDQITFVKELSSAIVDDILNKIVTGKVPAGWGGPELRQLLVDKFAESAYSFLLRMDKHRKTAYANAVIVNDL